ncbi:hypothetical protein LX36DRAFT_352105 [Colletotrichum falcatum]|nr:hypothetical protein LX36DRAFT_352105 [Colletotrichum falcatum]
MPGKRGLADSRSVEDELRRPTSPYCWIKASCPHAPHYAVYSVCLCPLLRSIVLLPAFPLLCCLLECFFRVLLLRLCRCLPPCAVLHTSVSPQRSAFSVSLVYILPDSYIPFLSCICKCFCCLVPGSYVSSCYLSIDLYCRPPHWPRLTLRSIMLH